MENAGEKNAYVCQKCGGETVTVNLADGVTPFVIKCRARWPGECDGMAQSRFYQIDQSRLADWGWYRPEAKDLEGLEQVAPGITDHVNRGGLTLRKLDSAERETYGGHRVRHG